MSIHNRKIILSDDVDLSQIASQTDGLTGAQLRAIVVDAHFNAMDEGKDKTSNENDVQVFNRHFQRAIEAVISIKNFVSGSSFVEEPCDRRQKLTLG